MNLLESAGFSRANPYYVVQQGKVGIRTLFAHNMLAHDVVILILLRSLSFKAQTLSNPFVNSLFHVHAVSLFYPSSRS